MKYPILDTIRTQADLKALPDAQMDALAAEIREFLVEHVSENGGHLASNLGVVELTMALHRAFDLPSDRIIFDVGHQSYVHKLLTGRKESFSTLRTGDGLSGFTNRAESPCDAFGAGHSSTSLSAALGFVAADALKGEKHYTVAVIGDGAFTGGMIHEALNNCPKSSHLILILNENEMSISRNIGRYARHLAKLRASKGYLRTKGATRSVLRFLPPLYKLVRAIKQAFKNMLYHSNYFEEMGVFYLGPANGNDYRAVSRLLTEAKNANQTTVIHLKTKKGKGHPPAEAAPNAYHNIPPRGVTPPARTFSKAFGEQLCRMAEDDPSICAITAAMCDGTGLKPFRDAYRSRFFDVGIAEEHALTFAAGLAAAGMKPVFAVYSTFLQRGYDNLIHDIALQSLPVTVAIDRAGLNVRDGATHHGIFDVAMLMGIPNFALYAPITEAQLAAALSLSLDSGAPAAIRYPHADSVQQALEAAFPPPASAEPAAQLLPRADAAAHAGASCLILTYGQIAGEALRAEAELTAQGIPCGTVLLSTLKPLAPSIEAIKPYIESATHLLFLEEGIRAGGVGACLGDALARKGLLAGKTYDVLAIDDHFAQVLPAGEKYRAAGISASDAVEVLRMRCEASAVLE